MINTKKQLCEYIKKSKNIIIIIFIAKNCNKSKKIINYFNNNNISYKACYIDNNKLSDYKQIWNIKLTPTIMFLKLCDRTVIPKDKITGININMLICKLKYYNIIV